MVRGERFEDAETRRARRAADAEYVRESDERRAAVEAEQQAGHAEAARLEAEAAAIRAKLSEAEHQQAEERAARDRQFAEGIVARYDQDEAACRRALDEARKAFRAAAATDGADTVGAYRAILRASMDLYNAQNVMSGALGTLGTEQHNGSPFRVGIAPIRSYSQVLEEALDAYGRDYRQDGETLAGAERASFIVNGGGA